MTPAPSSRRDHGFTLIELLVAITIMAMLAILSWRGLDGMTRAQAQTQQRADEVLTLQASLAQWSADLDALAPSTDLGVLDWDGRVLRLTRRDSVNPGDGLRVVAWTRRADAPPGLWLRWQSQPLRTSAEWGEAWRRAQLWAQNASGDERQREVALVPLLEWQIFYFRGGAWSNPLSSDGSAPTGSPAATASTTVPDGVRLVLVLPPGQAMNGRLTLDWVRPTVGGGKS